VQQFGGSESFMPAEALRNDGNLAALQADPTLRISTQAPIHVSAVTEPSLSSGGSQVDKKSGFASPKDFVKTLYPMAQRAAEVLNIDPKALLAQAAVETGWGQYVMHQGESSAHNLFGIKADSRWQGEAVKVSTLEYRDGTAHKEQAQFRRYDSYSESMQDYVDFMQSNPRYSEALSQTHDTHQYFNALQQAGYATDPNYAKKVLQVMDSDVFSASINTATTPLGSVSDRQVGE
jgi:flagellar protein FlgJ